MKVLLAFSRIFIGSIFILSGLIKANDAVGFSYKLDEYFSPAVFDLPFFQEMSLAIAIIVCVVEIVLGLTCIFGVKKKLTAVTLLGFLVFFGFLTFYSAYFNKVTDCGCFGDALKFTPWQSFIKDIVLLVFAIPLFIGKNHNSYTDKKLTTNIAFLSLLTIGILTFVVFNWTFPLFFSVATIGIGIFLLNKTNQNILDGGVIISSTILSLIFTWYTYTYLPIKDYRPYKVEANITEGMKVPADAKPGITHVFIENLTTGEVKGVLMKDIPWNDKNWKYRSDLEPKVIQEADEAPIHDFSMNTEDGTDIAEQVLGWKKVLVLVSYDLDKSNDEGWKKVQSIIADAKAKNLPLVGLSASDISQATQFAKERGVTLPFYNTDETTLKTIVRSNPGILLLEEGVIKGKWHFNKVPSAIE
ncbi:MAG: MauE/DoxX family redox-associated membrane protein [Flavobacteriales bacterium]